jgi:hypothetical protein
MTTKKYYEYAAYCSGITVMAWPVNHMKMKSVWGGRGTCYVLIFVFINFFLFPQPRLE